VPRDGIVRVVREPLLEDPHGLVDFSERAVRERK
jgi:hypothetical protein